MNKTDKILTLRERQIFSRDYSLEEIDRHIYHTNSPLIKKYREFADIITKTKNFETFYYNFDGNFVI